MYVKYSKLKEEILTPERANPSDAGLDVFSGVEKTIKIMPNTSAVIGTGLKFEIPHGYMLEAKNRSSVAAKKHLLVGACVIDPQYEGEVFINLHNVGSEPREVKFGDKIAQLVLIPVVHFIPELVPENKLYNNQVAISNRGEGTLGSTDK